MALFDRIRGRAGEADAEELASKYEDLLGPGESVAAAYQVARDVFLFTDWRLIFVDKQGLTGSKVEYESIPYASIRKFSVESAGALDRDAELKLWIAGSDAPLEKDFSKDVDIYELQSILALGIAGEDVGGSRT